MFILDIELQDTGQENMTLKWQNGVISNFDYLMYLNRYNGKLRIGKITISFNHVSTYCYSLANRQGLFAYVRTCKTRLDTTTKFMVVVTSMFPLVISSFPDNMFYYVCCNAVDHLIEISSS